MYENNNQFNGNVGNRAEGVEAEVIINSVITVNNGSELPAAPTVSLYYIILFIHPLFTTFIIIITSIISENK